MNQLKVLIAACSNTSIATNIQSQFEELNYKVNIIGKLSNIMVSVMLDKPDIICIHFHEFTHNALDLARQVYEKYNVPSLFIISSEAFREALELSSGIYVLDCLSIPFSTQELQNAL